MGSAECLCRPQLLWKRQQPNLRTKIILYINNAKSVLFYDLEFCGVVKDDMKETDAFGNGCIRKICGIF